MNQNARSGFPLFIAAKKKQLFVTTSLIVLILSSMLFSFITLASDYARKAHAVANGDIYPAPITKFPTPSTNSWPDGITTGPDHNLWFTEYHTNKIGRVTPQGTMTEFSLSTNSNNPTGITVGPDGNLWFTERWGSIIGRITPQGSITEFPSGNYGVVPGSITAGPDGNLWFADYTGAIGRITPQGKITEFPIPSGSINPDTITAGPDGNLWFTSISQVGRITPQGAITEFSLNSPYGFPTGITAGPDGNLWFAEYNSSGSAIGRITPKGVITDFHIPNITYPDKTTWSVNPADPTTGPDGNLWFTSNAQAIGRITPQGDVTEFISQNASSFGGGISPTGITVGPDGNIWFADYGRNQIGYLAVGGTSPIPTLPPPTSTAPSLKEYIQASNATYGLDTDNFSLPANMTELTRKAVIKDGFEAVALQDSNNNIIIANEGANIASPFGQATPYQNWSAFADGEIILGYHPAALDDAVTFVQSVQQQYGSQGKIYVTGHDLGGVEAEAEAQGLPSIIAGGASFGASGLPKNATGNDLSTFVNYVEFGDSFGGWTSDVGSNFAAIAPKNMYHYGSVQQVGNPSNAYLIKVAAQLDKLSTRKYVDELEQDLKNDAAENAELRNALKNILPIIGFSETFVNTYGRAIASVKYTFIAAAMYRFHPLAWYAGDFQISLKQTVVPEAPMGADFKLYDPTATDTDIKNAQVATITKTGTLTSPTINVAVDAHTGVVTNEAYIDNQKSVDDVIFDPNTKVSSVLVNENNTSSYQIYHDDLNTYSWSSCINFYRGKDGSGSITEKLYNWHAGGSQVQLFTGLPPGKHEEVKDYSGPDGTGKLLNMHFK